MKFLDVELQMILAPQIHNSSITEIPSSLSNLKLQFGLDRKKTGYIPA
jgi:hypothetical protein